MKRGDKIWLEWNSRVSAAFNDVTSASEYFPLSLIKTFLLIYKIRGTKTNF